MKISLRLLPIVRERPFVREGRTDRAGLPFQRIAPTRRLARRDPDLSAMVGRFAYQREGVEFLRAGSTRLLSYEMRMGKTNVALQSLDGPAIVVCPKIARLVWRDECLRWRPDLTPRFYASGDDPRTLVPGPREVVICHEDALPDPIAPSCLVRAALYGVQPIIDEAHRMKNRRAKRTLAVRALVRQCRAAWLLTGTPLLGTPLDLWGVLETGLLHRQAFGSFSKFCQLFHAKKKKWGGLDFGLKDVDFDAVRECMGRIMLARRKIDVNPLLPGKEYIDVPVEIPTLESVDLAEGAWQLHGATTLPPFAELSKAMADLASAKASALLELVEEHEEAGHDALLVFSRHLAPLRPLFHRKGWGAIHGDVSDEDRYQLVKAFQAGKLRGLAITIQTGSMALNLSRASHEIFVSCDYTPAMNRQAEDRPYSLDRETPLVIERLIADHPLDRRLFEILARKEHLADEIIGAKDSPSRRGPEGD